MALEGLSKLPLVCPWPKRTYRQKLENCLSNPLTLPPDAT